MWLEKYLFQEEKNNINKLSEVQSDIVWRREALFRIINNRNNCVVKKVDEKIKSSNNVKNNSEAYRKFLKSEWFIFEEKIVKDLTKTSNNNNYKDIYKWYFNLINNIYNYSKNTTIELNDGLSNIDNLIKIISDFDDYSKDLNKYRNNNKVSKEFNSRILDFLSTISSLNTLLNNSKWDIIDYYSYKSEILDSFFIITNTALWIMKSIKYN